MGNQKSKQIDRSEQYTTTESVNTEPKKVDECTDLDNNTCKFFPHQNFYEGDVDEIVELKSPIDLPYVDLPRPDVKRYTRHLVRDHLAICQKGMVH